MDDPFGQGLSGTTALGNAKAEGVAVKEVTQPGLGSDVGVAIGRIGNGAIDAALDACTRQGRHARHSVLNVALEPAKIVIPQLVGKIIGHAIEPHRRGLPLVGPEDEAVTLLPQVVRGVRVAQEWQAFAAVFELWHVFSHQVLVRHHGNRQMPTDHGHDLTGAVTGSVDHHLGHHIAFVGGNQPLTIWLLRQSSDPGVPAHAGAKFTRRAGQRLGQLRWVNVTIQRVPQRTQQVMGLDKGVAMLQITERQDVVVQPIRLGHALYMVEFIHAVAGMRQPYRACHVVVDRVLGRGGQLTVERSGILLQLEDAPAGRKSGQIAGSMPG